VSETTTKWPKALRELTPEEQAVHDDFMRRWHEVLPRRYGVVERFNHSFPVRHSRPGFRATMEIGAGLGEHLSYEHLSAEQERNYVAVELRDNMAARLSEAYPRVQTIVGDCQERLPFEDGSFDRYVAIHVLEHLPNLPACIAEAWRLLDKDRGQLLAVIPCEGGLAYSFARRVSAQRLFERTYRMPYERFISREHINRPYEILGELARYFTIDLRRYFPLTFIPSVQVNICIGLVLRPRKPLGEARLEPAPDGVTQSPTQHAS
jgi:SAM-dependent methyltransferase